MKLPIKFTPTVLIAGVLTLASVVFTTWSVYDLATPHAPALVALFVGVGVEAFWLFILATEWQRAGTTGERGGGLTVTGWVLAGVAAAVIGVHGVLTSLPMAALAVLPLAAKSGWHWQTRLRAEQTSTRLEAQEQAEQERVEREQEAARRAARLSAELTEEQQAELAELDRRAAYVQAKSKRQRTLAQAQARAEQEERLDQIRRDAEQQMAADEATAQIHVRRAELAQKIQLAAPVHTATQIGTGPQVPNDASGITDTNLHGPTTSVAGFGAVFTNQGGAPPAPPVDQQMPPHTPGDAPRGASPAEGALSGPQRLLDYVTQAGNEATVKGAAREMGVHPRTIRRYRERLAEAGHDVSALGTDPSRQ